MHNSPAVPNYQHFVNCVGLTPMAVPKDTAGSGDLHRREEVEKLLLNPKSLSQFQDKMKSRSNAPYRLPGMPIQLWNCDKNLSREAVVSNCETVVRTWGPFIYLECVLRSGEHRFPLGKLFKLTIVLEPFRVRSDIRDPDPDFDLAPLPSSPNAPIGDPAALNLVYYYLFELNQLLANCLPAAKTAQ